MKRNKLTRKQLQALPFGRRVKYLFCTYVWDLVLGAFLVSAISALIYEDYFRVQPLLRVDMINVNQESADSESFDGFLRNAGQTGEVKIEKRFQFGHQADDLACMPEQILGCSMAVGKTDLYFWDTPDMEQTLANTVLMDLRQVLPEEYLLENQDKLIYTAPLLDGGYPCGISLRDNQWVRENNYYGDCAVGISKKTRAPELTGQFLEYIG